MATIPTYDPLSTEARSPLIAGLTEGLSKISTILNMSTTNYEDMPLQEIYISADKEHLLYQAPLGNKLWLSSPTPVVKVNGVVTSEVFDLDLIGGSVRFQDPLNSGDTVTVTATGVTDTSEELVSMMNTLKVVEQIAKQYKGYFATVEGLNTAHSTGTNGDYAIVGETNSIWVWSSAQGRFIETKTDLSDYITAAEIAKLYITKAKSLETFYTKTEMPDIINNYLSEYAVTQDFDD